MINYSIIIPHKNIPHLLVRCLESIPLREDVQIIVVDDNSNVLEVNGVNFISLQDKFPYVEFIFAKNEGGRKGAGYARNLGMEQAKGNWLVFADADDFFSTDFEHALNKFKDDENDLICFKFNCVNSDTLEEVSNSSYISLMKKLTITHNKNLIYNISSIYSKFIKRTLVQNNNILFQEVLYCNDNWFNLQIVYRCIKFNVSDYEIYFYAVRNNSLTTKNRDFENIRIRIDVLCQALKFIRKVSPENLHFWLNEYYMDIAAWKSFRQQCILIYESYSNHGLIILWLVLSKYLVPNLMNKIIHNQLNKSLKRFIQTLNQD